MSNRRDSGPQAQKAGADAFQIQAGGDITLGVSEERVRQIVDTTAQRVFAEYTEEALTLIQDRIVRLDDRVIASLVRENRLHVFADPGFQRTYRKAQEGAAVSDRDEDYDLLYSLLADRAARGADRPIRLGIERAVENVDRIDDEALRGLTVLQAVMQYRPAGGDIELGLDVLEKLLGQLLDGDLPAGSDWLDHLDLLDAVRYTPSTKFRKFSDFWPSQHMPGYMSVGLEKSAAPTSWVCRGAEIPWMVTEHMFKPGFVRVEAPSAAKFAEYNAAFKSDEIEFLMHGAESIFHLSEIDESCRGPLMTLVRRRPGLRAIEEWWDGIPGHASVTAMGRVLARADMKIGDVSA